MLKNESLPGNCGINVFHGFNKIDQTKQWSIDLLASELGKKTTYDKDKPMLQPIVVFSYSSAQDKHPLNPRSFAEWLKAKGERVFETKPYLHKRHDTKIIGYQWHPSLAFREEFATACKTK